MIKIPKELQKEGVRFVLLEKSGKKPFQKDWQNKKIKYDDKELLGHLKKGGNYGIIGGGQQQLIVVDFDNERIQEQVCEKLPKTFTVKTGSGMLHKYFISNKCESFKIFDEEMNTLADIQGEGKQVVGPNSIHPNGNPYKIIDNSEIHYIPYAELKAIMEQYNKKPKKQNRIEYPKKIDIEDNFIDELKKAVKMSDILNSFGIDTSKNPTECYFHSSKGGKCLGYNEEVAHCFHCIHPEQEIITLGGIKRAGDVVEGDVLINAFGQATKTKKVTVHKSYDKKVLEIYVKGNNQPLKITENHGCFYYKDVKLGCGKIRGKSYKLKKPTKFIGKLPAKELTTKDALFIPEIKIEKDYNYLKLPFKAIGGYETRTNTINQIPLNKETLWMIGMYLAEGNSFRGGIKFSLHKKERKFAKKLIKIFNGLGINVYLFNQKTPIGEALLVNVCRTELSYSFKKLFGKICDKKKIPKELLFLPNSKLKYLLKGILDGDGSKRDFYIRQTSNQLSVDMLIIGRKLGYFCSRSIDRKREGRKQTYSNYFSTKGFGKIKIGSNQLNPITSIKEKEYSQQVIDITVEGHPSFLTPQGIIGNCDGSWNIFSFVKEAKNCGFKESIEYLANLAGMEDELEKSRQKYINNLKQNQRSEKKEIKEQFLDLIKEKKFSDASEIIVNYIKRNYYIYTTKEDEKSEVWVYKDGIYVPHGKSEIKVIMREILGKWFNNFYYNQVMNKLEPDTMVDPQEFFKEKYIYEIPLQNGILNILTKELKEFTPEKIFFNKLPVEYNSLADCPQIENFLKEVLKSPDDIDVFYELGGFCLMKEYKFEKAFMFVGDGRNGKDKSLELIKRMIGVENCCSVPLSSLVPDSFIMSEFFRKMVNVAGDIDNKDLKDTSTFKSLTGRSLISAPRKFLNPITFINYAKFIFACNELPMVYDTSRGFWDRWVLLEFPYTFVTKDELDNTDDENLKLRDENIIEKITSPQELSGFLNKCLEGLDRLLLQKDFSSTMGSEEIKNTWIRKSNSVMAFCMDKIEEDYDNYITKKEFRKKYTEYCKKHKIKSKSDYVIKRTLEELFGASEGRKEVLGIYQRVWEGIKWK